MNFILAFSCFLILIPLCDFFIAFILKKCIKDIPAGFYKKSFIFSFCNILLFPLFFGAFRMGLLSQDSLLFKIIFVILYSTLFCRIAVLLFIIITFAFLFNKRIKGVYPMIMGVVLATSFVYFVYCSIYSRVNLDVKKIELCSPKIPESFNGFTIVQISDFHLGSFNHTPSYINKVVERVNGLKPDLILFTGDLVNSRADEILPYVDVLSELSAEYGVYSILGNHDYGRYFKWDSFHDELKNFENFLFINEQMEWKLLNNESVRIGIKGDSISILGVENWGRPPFTGSGDLKKAMKDVPSEDFKILMTHNPDHWIAEVVPQTDIDLTLSGHTHSMQIEIPMFGKVFSPSEFIYDRWGGMYEEENQYLYVNKGLGYTLIPMRIGAYPEITVFELKNQNFCN